MSTEIIKLETLPVEMQEAIQKSGLPHEKAQNIIGKFVPFMHTLSELEAEIKDINSENPTAEDAKKARALRLRYVPNRTAAEKEKKKLKENVLIEGRLIDSMYNVVENASKMKEKHLEDIEKHQERIEKAAKDVLRQERELELGKYVADPKIYPLGELDEVAWKQLLEGQQAVFEKNENLRKQQELTIERENQLRPYMEIPTAFSLGSISQESFDDLLAKAKTAHEEKLEQERLEREREKRTNNRIQTLSSMGFTYHPDMNHYARTFNQDGVHLISYPKTELENDKDEAWVSNLSRISGIVDDEKKFIAHQNELKNKRTEKRLELCKPYGGDIYKNMIADMDEQSFDSYLAGIKKAYEEKQEAARVAKELADKNKADETRAAEMAARAEADAQKGDKEKMDDLIKDLDTLKTKYVFKSKKHTRIQAAANKAIDTLISNIMNNF